jgi:cytochrome c biogenesis protein CcmG/thiol:disulfide interchange protein DsbE
VTRRQVIGFVVVLALIAVGLVVKSRGKDANTAVDLAPLRQAAKLAPCPPGLGPELPDVTLPCLGGGKAVTLRGAAPGVPTLVNVWASWCHPCVAEVPELIAFTKKAAGRVAVVGVDNEDAPKDALTFAAQNGMHYPSLVDDDKQVLRTVHAAPGPPVTLFLDASGHITHVQPGQFHSLAEIEKLVATHLGVKL